MIQWTLYILLQYMYNICHYILTCTHAFLVSHRHRRYIRRGKCNYRYVYCIYVYDDYKNLWLCQCRQKSELRNLNSHDTKNTPFPDGGGVRSVQVVVFPFPPGFFQEALRFTFHKSRESRHFLLHSVAEVKANQWGGATGQASMLLQQTDSVDEMAAMDHISGFCGRNSNRKWFL